MVYCQTSSPRAAGFQVTRTPPRFSSLAARSLGCVVRGMNGRVTGRVGGFVFGCESGGLIGEAASVSLGERRSVARSRGAGGGSLSSHVEAGTRAPPE